MFLLIIIQIHQGTLSLNNYFYTVPQNCIYITKWSIPFPPDTIYLVKALNDRQEKALIHYVNILYCYNKKKKNRFREIFKNFAYFLRCKVWCVSAPVISPTSKIAPKGQTYYNLEVKHVLKVSWYTVIVVHKVIRIKKEKCRSSAGPDLSLISGSKFKFNLKSSISELLLNTVPDGSLTN